MGSVTMSIWARIQHIDYTNVQVALSRLNEHDLEIVVQVGQTACHHAAA